MATKLDVGPRIYQFAIAAATIAVSPLNDRALLVRRVLINNVSADDTWTFTCGGKEIFRTRVLTAGNQRLFLEPGPTAAVSPNFWDYCRKVLAKDPSIPVPNGQTLTVASVGGATADIDVEAIETDISDLSPSLPNHYLGTRFLVPLFASLAASQAAAGVVNCDTNVVPSWLPNLLIGTMDTQAWEVDLLAIFPEGMGVNTFSGAANHQSVTQTTRLIKNSVQLFSRTTSGIPNRGSASAAGSANTVFGQQSAVMPPFIQSGYSDENLFDVPVTVRNGDTLNVALELSGDLTGGASYARALQAFIAEVRRVS